MTATITNIRTAAEYRQMAADCYGRANESWERSDTDGFLSQWASQQMASRYLHNAQIVEDGGIITTVVVEIATGKVAATMRDQREGRYGYYFLIKDDEIAARTTRFFSESNARNKATAEANNAKKGFRLETRMVPLEGCYESRESGCIEVARYDDLKG